MGSLIARATLAVLAGLVLIVVGFGYMAAQWPAMFWLVVIPFFAFGVRHELRAYRIKLAALGLRLRDEHVPSMSPLEYEQFTARLLERAGWTVEHCGRAGDQGCDVVAELRGFKAVVQVKLYRSRVGNAAVQEIAAARRHYGAQIMVVVAPAGFTPSAQALAASNGVHLLHHSALPTLQRLARIP